MKNPKRPRDANQLAKAIVDIAAGDAEDEPKAPSIKAAGGAKGGRERALKLTPEQREEAARLAAQARWRKS